MYDKDLVYSMLTDGTLSMDRVEVKPAVRPDDVPPGGRNPAAQTFHPFPKLPREIQTEIWRLSMVPRQIEANCFGDSKPTTPRFMILSLGSNPFPCPNLYSTCRESRYLAISAYGDPKETNFFFNPEIDSVCLSHTGPCLRLYSSPQKFEQSWETEMEAEYSGNAQWFSGESHYGYQLQTENGPRSALKVKRAERTEDDWPSILCKVDLALNVNCPPKYKIHRTESFLVAKTLPSKLRHAAMASRTLRHFARETYFYDYSCLVAVGIRALETLSIVIDPLEDSSGEHMQKILERIARTRDVFGGEDGWAMKTVSVKFQCADRAASLPEGVAEKVVPGEYTVQNWWT